MNAKSSASSTSADIGDYSTADDVLWHDKLTLLLYRQPQFFEWSNRIKRVVPDTSSVCITWNAEDRTVRS